MTLRSLYNEFNRKHWGGRLPKNVGVEFSDWIPKTCGAAAHVHGITPCDPDYAPHNCHRSFIRIHPRFRDCENIVGLFLIHEMVHVSALLGNKLLVNHGPAFQREMKRIAAKGGMNDFW